MRGKGSGEANTGHKRIRITIETEQVLTIRGRVCSRLWCQQCGREVDVVRAEILTSLVKPTLGDGTGANELHCFEGPDGTPLVCLESLLKAG